MESSAKSDINISEIFNSLIDQIWQKNGGPPTDKKNKSKCEIL